MASFTSANQGASENVGGQETILEMVERLLSSSQIDQNTENMENKPLSNLKGKLFQSNVILRQYSMSRSQSFPGDGIP